MKLIRGVGVNDADYAINPMVEGKQVMCLFYSRWTAMLERCYSAKLQERCPTYKGCFVVEEWLTFSKFRKWMIAQDWEGNQLDKDLLIEGNKMYGPETCVFVCRELNSLLNERNAARGDLPLGVVKHKKKYMSQVNKNGKINYLGTFTSPEEAHQVWRNAKAQVILDSLVLTGDVRVKNALRSRAKSLQESPN